VIRVQTQPFDVNDEIAALTGGRTDIGAVVTFSGTVRGTVRGPAGPQPIRSMTLEHYPGMTEAELTRIEAEANARWPLQGSTIIHRVGELLPGDAIVLVIAASPHRHAAFEAASYLMDYLKTRAPFWKKETGLDGVGVWVDAREADDAALARWG
jgi:molybdopterin synthase catalytic subunit